MDITSESSGLVVKYRLPSESVCITPDMFSQAWDECIELQMQPKQLWIGQSLIELAKAARWELAFFIAQNFAGGIILAHDHDCHVGACMSVLAQYVRPEYRNQGISQRMMRESIRIAHSEQAPALAFTHRQGPWCYRTVYHKLRRNYES